MVKFEKPDKKTIARMTPHSIRTLLATLRDQRKAKVEKIDAEIKFYEGLLTEKEGGSDAKTSR